MKDKILNALKTTYAKLGLGDKAFDGVATFLEKTITDENEIVTRIKGDDVEKLLKAFQGETDSLRTARVKAEKDLEDYKKAHPSAPEKEEVKEEPEEDPVYKAALERLAAIEAKYAEMDKKAKRDAVVSGVRERLKQANCTSEPILDLILSGVEVGDNDTADTLAESMKSAYQEKYKLFYGNGAVPPIGGGDQSEPYKKGKFAGVVNGLVEEGALPNE
jgi:hypothetical protein